MKAGVSTDLWLTLRSDDATYYLSTNTVKTHIAHLSASSRSPADVRLCLGCVPISASSETRTNLAR